MILLLFIDQYFNNINFIKKNNHDVKINDFFRAKELIILIGIVSIIYLLLYSVSFIENKLINIKLYNNILIAIIIIDLVVSSFFMCNKIINIGIYNIESKL